MGDLIREGGGRIVITSPSGREIFNTNTPMPARLGVLTTNLSFTFPRAPGEVVQSRLTGDPFKGTLRIEYRRFLPSSELVYERVLGTVPEGVDFLLPNFKINSISRTYGAWNYPASAYTSGSAWYMANGSVLLEYLPHGSVRRAMHIFVDGSEIKCQFQQTNNRYYADWRRASQAYATSTYSFSFQIEYGTFFGA